MREDRHAFDGEGMYIETVRVQGPGVRRWNSRRTCIRLAAVQVQDRIEECHGCAVQRRRALPFGREVHALSMFR